MPYAGFYTKLNVWGSLGLNFDYDGGPIIENGGPIFLSDRNFRSFFEAGLKDDLDLSDSEQPLEDGSSSVSAFLLPKKFLRSLCFGILAVVYFFLII